MQSGTDWLALWRDLAQAHEAFWEKRSAQKAKETSRLETDNWADRAKAFDAMVRRRWARPDSSRDCILETLKRHPGASVLDIGAGTGAWALLMARHARKITALDPSPAMRRILAENIRRESLSNITILDGGWPEAKVEMHDFSLASHSMYGQSDFETFVRRMQDVTRHTCFLLMRVSLADSVMAKAAMLVWGQPHDSPNFQVAYNALLQMGIYPNVLLEPPNHREPRRHDSFDEALAETLDRFGLTPEDRRAPKLEKLLREHLTPQDDGVLWPAGTRSAIIFWRSGDVI